ncbi:hypothetical protein [Microcystis aeruginosa]|uniref:hypothetical protein n=1 Tax=Microcystis aeruginosa TaxID=1126 RepID=UPI0010317284|nr:hypothetical protein [Microcystis aeruginosa]
MLKKFVVGVSYQLSVISYQLSVISYQLSVISSLRKHPTPRTPHPTPGKTFSADPSIGDSTGIWKNSIPKTLPRSDNLLSILKV